MTGPFVRRSLTAALITALLSAAPTIAQDGETEKAGEEGKQALSLERIFPEKSLFGPTASQTSFSFDDRFGAYIYRPYHERRHGSDLYIFDTQTGVSRRITSAARMAEFQEDARKVAEDREAKAKKAGVSLDQVERTGDYAGEITRSDSSSARRGTDCTLTISTAKKGLAGELRFGLARIEIKSLKIKDGEVTGEIDTDTARGKLTGDIEDDELTLEFELEEPDMTFTIEVTRKTPEDDSALGVISVIEHRALGNIVLEDDADAETEGDKNPRYSGIQTYEWSPVADELILTSDGDLYLLTIDREAWESEIDESDPYLGDLSRLTMTREREGSVAYLPDGAGYTYLRDGALLKVSFGDHIVRQLDPELDRGESMIGYRISPDQTRLVFLTQRGQNWPAGGQQVNIVNYRDRFAQVRQVNRHMSDDPFPEQHRSIYLYDLRGHETEEGTLERVFTRKVSGPRDIMLVPEWSPDSSRIGFAAFEQSTGHVVILQAGFVPEEAKSEGESKDEEKAEGEEEETVEDEGEDEEAAGKPEGEAEEVEEPDFKIEEAEVVYKFLHNGGPNTPRMISPVFLPDSRRMAFITELSGFRQLHVLDPTYEQLTQLTDGQFEVYPFDQSEDHSTLFVTATKDDPNQEHVFSVNLETGDMTQLTTVEGVYSTVSVTQDGSMLLAEHADFASPTELYAIRVDPEEESDSETTRLTASHPEETLELTEPAPEYFTFANRHGQTIHGHMFKPESWTADDKRPLLIYVYGGPLGERKMATRGAFSAPSYFFARYMTEVHGWVTATVDPRGASGYGAVFEKANFEQVGKPQTEDLVDAANWLVENAGVDRKRMAMHGWSFGGFQTQMVMYTEPDVFAAGIAGAGPTEWHNYNSWYSTGTIGDSRTGKTDLDKYSLLPLAKNLKGRLLLVHGIEDSNVLYQDTVRVYRELLKADKEALVDLFLDPTGGHGLGGDVETINRYRKYEDFLLLHVGKGPMTEKEEEEEEEEEEGDPDDESDGNGD